MNEVKLLAGGLYVLSGPPGVGKSTLLSRSSLPEGSVVSSDALRRQFLGFIPDVTEGRSRTRYFAHADAEVFATLRTLARARAEQRLTTIIDATSVNDEARSDYFKIAQEAGVPFEVLILDVPPEVARQRNANREAWVPDAAIESFYARFERTSKYPHRLLADTDTLAVRPLELPHDRVDVIGDVHGLYDDLVRLIESAGWQVGPDGTPTHPQGRLLLFLGDVVDRGPQSLEALNLAYRAVQAGTGLMLKGNHEHKLLRFLAKAREGQLRRWTSFANAETGVAMLMAPPDLAAKLEQFIRQAPVSCVLEGDVPVAFVHADVDRFDPLHSPASDLIYGHSRHSPYDTDAEYQKRFEAGVNRYTLVRGHIPATSAQRNCVSLERNQAYAGDLVLMQLDQFVAALREGRADALEASLKTRRCGFNFSNHEQKYRLARELDALVGQKLAIRAEDSTPLRLFKYSKRVFFDNLWNANPYLAKARGIVLDVAGNIVSHPFDKVYNYRENGAGEGLSDDTEVVAVDKLNGFLGVMSRHPFKKNELLVTTTGSFDSDFVRYIQTFLSGDVRGALLKYLAREEVTLMFEVLHPDDPHIIKYGPEHQGLWLIGVRGKQLHDPVWPEEAIDEAAARMGLRRPSWLLTTVGELKALNAKAKTEGWMVRAADPQQPYLFKLKTPYYLTTKFIGRLSDNKIAGLFGNPKAFKQQLDEEFYPLVDALVAATSRQAFMQLPSDQRVALVRQLVDTLVE